VTSACAAAPCSLHNRADLFGDWGCEYYTTTKLADEMIGGVVDLLVAMRLGGEGGALCEVKMKNLRTSFLSMLLTLYMVVASLLTIAARSLTLPLPSPSLAALEVDYWSAMANGTGEPYDQYLGNLRPKMFDYTQCAETTSNTFWVGAPYDELARGYAAGLINNAYASPLFHGDFGDALPEILLTAPVSKHDTVAVSAMESAGWMEVLALEEVK